MKKLKLLPFFLLLTTMLSYGQDPCDASQIEVTVEVQTDTYGYETAWSVKDQSGTTYGSADFFDYENNSFYQASFCVPDSTCLTFLIQDSFGDGIFAPGFYRVIVGQDTLAQGGQQFSESAAHSFNCDPGEECESAIPVGEGFHTAYYDNSWYTFTPDSVGTYLISTCGLNDCDTKIWVYDGCTGTIAEDNQSTIFYNNDEGDCAPAAVVEAFFEPAYTYYIRIGDHEDACADSINWELTYLGPVVGCTDPTSCNYNPLATIDDGSCLPQGDPNCPAAPDLVVDQGVLSSSIFLSTINSTDPCLIEEGCLHGYGQRDIVRFTTWIANDGELDYFIGQPSSDNTQFTYDNCHDHFHYDGYAEYILYQEDGTEIPIGFKNGFCVIDLGCTTGSPQYGCNNMGITAGCHDIYSSALECQWIDVTDVQDGRYTFVTRVNWDNAPDKLGRVEKDTLNNWAQVCIILDRSSGSLQMSLDEDCAPYVDCTGAPYGNTVIDCEGNCGGTALRGDLDQNGNQETADAYAYVGHALDGDLTPTDCNDLNADGRITVFDASLLSNCYNYGNLHPHTGGGAHDHCNFPAGVLNTTDTTLLTILDTNFEEGYVDIGLHNSSARINAYQFTMGGITIQHVENLADEAIYPISPYGAGQTVIGLSYQDSTLDKSNGFQPLCRVYFSEVTEDFICIETIDEIINLDQEQTVTYLLDPCVEYIEPSSTREFLQELQAQVVPNPTLDQATLQFKNPAQHIYQLEVRNANGQLLLSRAVTGSDVELPCEQWPAGLYFYRLSSHQRQASGRFSVQ
ncbi:MAG: lysyl oxidase family protein [Phaeodactylibacter sp.]|uniref:lysyl oxidase family protein n=1 Tax=Phaeodactylibacter sp. TaxID=1940289 RepID=UPI0032EEDBC4